MRIDDRQRRVVDSLVVGGGPAGSAMAILLAQGGRDVALLERSTGPHDVVCGEFLSPEAITYLRGLGVEPLLHGAQPITHVRLAACELIAETALPAPALSLTRRTLDEALLQQALQCGAAVHRGVSVEGLQPVKEVWRAETRLHGEPVAPVFAREAYLATGKHDLRSWPRLKAHAATDDVGIEKAVGLQTNLIAMKMYLRLTPEQQAALAGHVELILFPGGYTGLQMVEGGVANLCALVSREQLRALGGGWPAVLQHMQQHSVHLARRLCGAEQLLAKPLALSAIPYGYRAAPAAQHAPWRLGDQAAVIPSFSGDGMSIALHSAHLAARMTFAGAGAAAFQVRLREELSRPVRLATALSRAMVEWPALAHAVRWWPGVLHPIFNATRVPPRAMEHALRRPQRNVASQSLAAL